MKTAPSRTTDICVADHETCVNGVRSEPADTTTEPAPSMNIGVTRAECEELTIILVFTVAIAVFASVPLSGQNAWPRHARSASASGGLMLTVSGLGATSLVAITAALQSPAVRAGRLTSARTRMYIVVSGSTATRCEVAVIVCSSAISKPSSESATCTW